MPRRGVSLSRKESSGRDARATSSMKRPPTDGILSRTWGDGNAPNTTQNFAGQVGVVVPEPTTWALLGLGGIGLGLVLRRRSA